MTTITITIPECVGGDELKNLHEAYRSILNLFKKCNSNMNTMITSPQLLVKSKTTTSGKLTQKQKEVDALFNPDEQGCSEWVLREKITASVLDWGNNGVARHGVYFGDKRYKWEKKGQRRITALRTIGFSDSYLYNACRPIRNDIHEYHKKMGCVVCGSHSDLVTDHKNDLYNDPRVLNVKTQTIDDFQCLCNHCNLQKRQVSKKTKEIRKRIGATTIPSYAVFGIDFVEGDETFDEKDINCMVGTYWYDPIEFARKIKENQKEHFVKLM